MEKAAFQCLAMIITDICNLNCDHCLQGKKEMRKMSDEVIESTLNQARAIGTLSICGGEITLALDRLEKIITYIIESHIYLESLTLTINGSIYSEDLLRLLEEINDYIGDDKVRAFFAISLDKYHLDEMVKRELIDEFAENIKRYKEHKCFYDFRTINKKLFREGNAVNLDDKITVPLRPNKHFITYINSKGKFDRTNGRCNIGPIVSITPGGVITECDASLAHQKTLYNYGNVLNGSIEEQLLQNKAIVLKPKAYIRACERETKRFNTYNK